MNKEILLAITSVLFVVFAIIVIVLWPRKTDPRKTIIKAVIWEEPYGTSYAVYQKRFWFWIKEYGLKYPVKDEYDYNLIIGKEIERLKKVYGKNLIIEDRRIAA